MSTLSVEEAIDSANGVAPQQGSAAPVVNPPPEGHIVPTEALKPSEPDALTPEQVQAAIDETAAAVEADAAAADAPGDTTPEGIAEAAGLDVAAIAAEFDSAEGLSEATVETLSAKAAELFGLDDQSAKGMVYQYFSGIQATRQAATNEALSVFPNGKSDYDKAVQWAAAGGMQPAEIDQFNSLLGNAQSPNDLKQAATLLKSKFDAVHGSPAAAPIAGSSAPTPSISPIRSRAEYHALMNDPQYAANPAFRAKVQARVEAGIKQGVYNRA